METWLQIVIAVFSSTGLWAGFWAWIQSRREKKDAKTQMLLGLGHDRIVYLCMKYIDRGWISSDEHEDLIKYLYTPYVGMKGNGTAQRLIEEINRLPIKNLTYVQQAKNQKSSQQERGD